MPPKSAKTTKQELKAILKQCLREILKEEGFLLAEGATRSNNRVPARESVSSPSVPDANQLANSRLEETVNSVSRNFEGKSNNEADLMRSILADTALTTLQEQQANGHSVGAGGTNSGMPTDVGDYALPATPQQKAKDSAELESLSFQGDTSRWASIAFAGKR